MLNFLEIRPKFVQDYYVTSLKELQTGISEFFYSMLRSPSSLQLVLKQLERSPTPFLPFFLNISLILTV